MCDVMHDKKPVDALSEVVTAGMFGDSSEDAYQGNGSEVIDSSREGSLARTSRTFVTQKFCN